MWFYFKLSSLSSTLSQHSGSFQFRLRLRQQVFSFRQKESRIFINFKLYRFKIIHCDNIIIYLRKERDFKRKIVLIAFEFSQRLVACLNFIKVIWKLKRMRCCKLNILQASGEISKLTLANV